MERKNGERIERVRVVALATTTADGNGVGTFLLHPTSGSGFISDSSTKLAAIADLFSYFRIRSLKIRIHGDMPSAVSNDYYGGAAIGCSPFDTVGTPTSLVTVLDCPWSRYLLRAGQAPVSGAPSWPRTTIEHLVVPKAAYTGQVSWYKTVTGATDDQLEIPGVVYTFGTASITHTLETEVEWEFRGFVGPSLTALARRNLNAKPTPEPEWSEVKSSCGSSLPSDRGSNPGRPPPRELSSWLAQRKG